MTEREMEDLIAAHPEDFFPRRGMVLRGRQRSFVGVGRYDLLFEDEHRTNILMELKAVPAKYDDASQLAKYKEALEQGGHTRVLMWLVATLIPRPVRDFMDQIGIEYTEIHEAEYKAVAHRHDTVLGDEAQKSSVIAPCSPTVRTVESMVLCEGISIEESTMRSYQLFKEQKNRFVEELLRVDKDVTPKMNWKELNPSYIRKRQNWFIAIVPNRWALFKGGLFNVHFGLIYRRDTRTKAEYVRFPVGVEGPLNKSDEFKKHVVKTLKEREISLPGCAIWPNVPFQGKKLIEPSLTPLNDDSWKLVLDKYLMLGEFVQVVADALREYTERHA
jgi:hypothetical protein